ncbi:Inhibitor of sigma-G Gin [Geosporobacter subterraneus DSM 17957]|uniref:Inhibitor of sigma-G Gin n=2 Tax=Geosporobacter TaxID=390805 RepID=A0A1M6PSS9_9FIRM|nr:Inhibitor of sigma-G Gin [Geosporobacter subterraneus DSM 17957]
MREVLCFTCRKTSTDYIELFEKYICESCQNQILSLNPEDYGYSYFHNKVKILWEEYLESLVKNQVINHG